MKRRTPEGYVLQAVTDLLTAERIPYHRLNSGSMLLTGENGKRRMVRMAPAGTADILALPRFIASDRLCDCGDSESSRVVPVYIEVKAERGKQSPAQIEFQQKVQRQGFCYLLARSSDDVLAWLRGRRSFSAGV